MSEYAALKKDLIIFNGRDSHATVEQFIKCADRIIAVQYEEISQLQTEVERLRGERDGYKLRLSELCQLKAIKDKYGKTEEYKLRQPVAWNEAFALLQQKKGKDDDNKR